MAAAAGGPPQSDDSHTVAGAKLSIYHTARYGALDRSTLQGRRECGVRLMSRQGMFSAENPLKAALWSCRWHFLGAGRF